MTKKRKKIEKLGNAKCTICGLRASSKNVAIRHVFICWPEVDMQLEHLEHMVKAYNHKGIEYYRIAHYDETLPAAAMGQWFKQVYDHSPSKYEANLKKLLCIHEWQQDRGTATV
jgi:hypothetical protein